MYVNDSSQAEPKTPRLDTNVVFAQLKGSEEAVSEIYNTISDSVAVGESC